MNPAEVNSSNQLIDCDRLWNDLMRLGEITESDKPFTRRSFSETFLKGRAYLSEAFEAAGLEVRTDENGNLIGRCEGARPELGTLVIGSHSDTVPGGGRFDGVAGVVAGLEIARVIKQSGIQLCHSLEVMDCLAEEMSEYGLSCVGSRGLAGEFDDLMGDYLGPSGETLAEAIDRIGGSASQITQDPRNDIAGYLELHIEQGRVLQDLSLDVGIVTNVVGITRMEIDVAGLPDHAGTTPMTMRHDALGLAARIAIAVETLAQELAAKGQGYFVATTGEFHVSPNAANVVPGGVRMVIDARSDSRDLIEQFIQKLHKTTSAAADGGKANVRSIKVLSDSASTQFDSGLVDQLQASADQLGLKSVQMPSGAGHDAVFFSRIAPTAMVFVPSKDGRSHCPEEWSEPHQIAAGTAVLLNTLLRVDAASD